jgi:hypothetical protein
LRNQKRRVLVGFGGDGTNPTGELINKQQRLLAALRWEHPWEKDPDPTFLAPRTIIYPMEIADLRHKIRTRHGNLVPDSLVGVCGDIAVMISAWERNVDFKMFCYEEALATDQIVASWISFAKM